MPHATALPLLWSLLSHLGMARAATRRHAPATVLAWSGGAEVNMLLAARVVLRQTRIWARGSLADRGRASAAGAVQAEQEMLIAGLVPVHAWGYQSSAGTARCCGPAAT